MKQIFSAYTIIEAHIVAGLLEQHGIDCHVSGHYLQGAVGELPAGDFAHITVEEADIERAEKLIKDYESGVFRDQSHSD